MTDVGGATFEVAVELDLGLAALEEALVRHRGVQRLIAVATPFPWQALSGAGFLQWKCISVDTLGLSHVACHVYDRM